MSASTFKLTLHIWRQKQRGARGEMKQYELDGVSGDMSFLEMLDVLNEKLITEKHPDGPVAFDHDCREGICGMCGVVVNGEAHGPQAGTTCCQLHMRTFEHGEHELWIEPWRADAFPVLKDLIVDRTAFDRIIQAGGYVSVHTGSAPDGNAIPIGKNEAELSMDAAACIGCGACVAACPNASAMLFTSAKVAQLALLPQGQPERFTRVKKMVAQMEKEGFGYCTNHKECEAVCPKEISVQFITQLNRDLLRASVRRD
ncbi:MAG: succinate dehydrogenase/fumarate reductase iron-sulfur subunit [Myxococcales bacterium]|nr:succinate dehydrogenase/fumarate reductase iron-sulfur subunit [Myxococcales bacterium]